MAAPRKPSKPAGKTKDPLIAFCRGLPGATEDVKWGNDLVFSVGGKMFAGFQIPDYEPLGFKVDPIVFASLVGKRGIVPAPYAARFHWVSVTDRRKVPVGTLKELIAESHRLVAEKLSKKLRASLQTRPNSRR